MANEMDGAGSVDAFFKSIVAEMAEKDVDTLTVTTEFDNNRAVKFEIRIVDVIGFGGDDDEQD